jgi:hypothetical protein
MEATAYPWYRIVLSDLIEQGDILDSCPVFFPPVDLDAPFASGATFRWEEQDVIVLTQTCDLMPGREKVSDVLLCPVWRRSELTAGHLATAKGMEDVRRGNLPGFISWPIAAWTDSPARFASSISGGSIRSRSTSPDVARGTLVTGSVCSHRIANTYRKPLHDSSCASASPSMYRRSVEGTAPPNPRSPQGEHSPPRRRPRARSLFGRRGDLTGPPIRNLPP